MLMSYRFCISFLSFQLAVLFHAHVSKTNCPLSSNFFRLIPIPKKRQSPLAAQGNMIQATHTTQVTRWKTIKWSTRAAALLHFVICMSPT